MRATYLLLPALAVGAAAYLAAPEPTRGFTLIGDSLGQSQRDVRVFDNFLDDAANNNTTPDPNWPGYGGAEQALWKGAVEWQSEIHGDGSGDPHQPGGVGSGGANFDPSWQGNATGIGNVDQNIISALDANGGGILAFAEGGVFNSGWRIRFYENHGWADGPGTTFCCGNFDIQAIGAHEYGHALGLGHTFNGPTMQPGTGAPGTAQRSIEADDMAGVQAIYGAMAASKPHVDSVSVNGNQVTITGSSFDAGGNEVWFTQAGAGGNGSPVKVTNVSSNGSQITVTIPGNAGPGDLLVRRNGTGFDDLSNAFPFDPSVGPPPPGPPAISGFSPSSIDAVTVDGPAVITISGSDFATVDAVTVDGIALATFPAEFNVVDDSTITFDMPLVSKLGAVDVQVSGPQGSDTAQLTVVANDPPVMELASSDPSFLTSVNGIQLSHGGEPGELYFSFLSTSLVPSSLPGLFDLGIGNGLLDLFLIVTPTIGPKGYQVTGIPFSGIAPGTQLHFQGGVFELSFALPLTATNVQSGTVLF